jgi:hypothetical protein
MNAVVQSECAGKSIGMFSLAGCTNFMAALSLYYCNAIAQRTGKSPNLFFYFLTTTKKRLHEKNALRF